MCIRGNHHINFSLTPSAKFLWNIIRSASKQSTMPALMRLSTSVILTFFATSVFALYFLYKPKPANKKTSLKTSVNLTNNNTNAIHAKMVGIKNYIKAKKFNTTHCFLIDMKIPSGKNRFFIYNLKKDSVEFAGLVAHGSSMTYSNSNIVFSNEPNSLCTSLGKYKIGASYYGKFGLAFKLYGLDSSNSNAYSRAVVLHGHDCVPSEEVYPDLICQSWGCPTVAPSFLLQLQSYITQSKKPILLCIYN